MCQCQWILLLLVWLWPLYGGSIPVTPQSDRFNITPWVSYLITPKSQYNYLWILQQERAFKDISRGELLLGYHEEERVWLRFDLANPSSQSFTKILAFQYPLQEQLYLYELESDRIYEQERTNALVPYYQLHFAPYERKRLLLEASNDDWASIVKLFLYEPTTFHILNSHRFMVIMLFVGAIGAILLYNLFLLFLTKDPSYLYYILMVATFSLLVLHCDGLLASLVEGFSLSKSSVSTLLLILGLAMIFFTRSFLELPRSFPRLDRSLDLLFISLVLLYLSNLVELIPTGFQRLYYIAAFAYLLYVGLYAYWHGRREALYYLLGWILLFGSALLLVLRQIGLSDLYDRFPYLIYVAILGEAMLFSMALSARINTMRLEKDRATQKLLERQTIERHRLEAYATKKTRELQKALEEKAMLFRELHHRIKNNLQIIISLLRLQADRHLDPKLGSILLEAENRIRTISQIHEMLYNREDGIHQIDLQHYFQGLVEGLVHSYAKKLQIRVCISSKATLDMDRAIYCGLIINELVTNALKYAFTSKEQGRITISFQEVGEFYELILYDDGSGFDPEKIQGLGLKIVRTLVERQLKGELRIDTRVGSYYEILFPR
ncbi:MAG: hypothetical protein C6I00_00400 [Nitratiruptor sp.]|nr:hypothetical protein [Nitratiruptor sp.]NPA84302.1 hypothetical protein [Campylobacterota bacterium]